MFVGFPGYLMPPGTFIREPFKWLKAISDYGGTFSGAPNFAYDLCVHRVNDQQKSELDLSSWVAFNGAEPIRVDTMDRFIREFEPCGFRYDGFFTCYGMAETTVFISGGPPLSPTNVVTVDSSELEQHRVIESDGTRGKQLVGCGQVGSDLEVRVVDPQSLTECEPSSIGEFWVHGASVTGGYWNRPEETLQAFGGALPDDDRKWLRTGDYGFMRNGEPYVTGRLKDLIIIHGRNLYPQDIEQVVEQHFPFLRPCSCCAFSVEAGGEEKLVVVAEGTRDMAARPQADDESERDADQLDGIIDDLRARIFGVFEVVLTSIIFVRPATFPRTSSGKLQRGLTRRMLASDKLRIVRESTIGGLTAAVSDPERTQHLIELVCHAFREWASDEDKTLPPLGGDTTLTSIGIDSIAVIDISFRIEKKLGNSVDPESLITARTIEDLAHQLGNGA